MSTEFGVDLRSAARTVRSQSWPIEMGEWAEGLANRLERYADRAVMDDAALDALVHRAEAWLKAPLDGPTATLRSLLDALQDLRLELARQEQHVESARAIARARREADTATIETLRDALAELLSFVTHQLDPDPGPWRDYFTDTAAQTLAAELEAERHPEQEGDT